MKSISIIDPFRPSVLYSMGLFGILTACSAGLFHYIFIKLLHGIVQCPCCLPYSIIIMLLLERWKHCYEVIRPFRPSHISLSSILRNRSPHRYSRGGIKNGSFRCSVQWREGGGLAVSSTLFFSKILLFGFASFIIEE